MNMGGGWNWFSVGCGVSGTGPKGLVIRVLVAWQADTPEWSRLIPGQLNLLCGADKFGKIWSAFGHHGICYRQ